MYEAIRALCEDNTILIATILALNNAYSAFKTTINAIVSADTMLETPTGGVTKSKNTSKTNLAKLGGSIAGVVSAYAVEIGDEVLEGEMKITESDILKATGMRPVELCTLIYDRASANMPALADYGVTPAVLTTLQNSYLDFGGKEPQPKVTIDMKKAKRIQVKGMFTDTDGILVKKMDKLIVNFEESDPGFLGAYKALRKPVKPAVTNTVLKLQILNAANDKPIKDARVYHDGTTKAKKSSVKGFVTYKDPPEGNHFFKVKHSLFKDVTTDPIMVSHGDKKTVVVKMEAV